MSSHNSTKEMLNSKERKLMSQRVEGPDKLLVGLQCGQIFATNSLETTDVVQSDAESERNISFEQNLFHYKYRDNKEIYSSDDDSSMSGDHACKKNPFSLDNARESSTIQRIQPTNQLEKATEMQHNFIPKIPGNDNSNKGADMIMSSHNPTKEVLQMSEQSVMSWRPEGPDELLLQRGKILINNSMETTGAPCLVDVVQSDTESERSLTFDQNLFHYNYRDNKENPAYSSDDDSSMSSDHASKKNPLRLDTCNVKERPIIRCIQPINQLDKSTEIQHSFIPNIPGKDHSNKGQTNTTTPPSSSNWGISNTADLLQQIAMLNWMKYGNKDKQGLEMLTSFRVGYEVICRLTRTNIIDRYQTECIASIVDYINTHPQSSESQLARKVQAEIKIFKERIEAL